MFKVKVSSLSDSSSEDDFPSQAKMAKEDSADKLSLSESDSTLSEEESPQLAKRVKEDSSKGQNKENAVISVPTRIATGKQRISRVTTIPPLTNANNKVTISKPVAPIAVPIPSTSKNPAPSAANNGNEKTNSRDEDGMWTLDKLRRVKINTFRGRKYVDIREFYEKNGQALPGKKGISLTVEQWNMLLELKDDINAALGR